METALNCVSAMAASNGMEAQEYIAGIYVVNH